MFALTLTLFLQLVAPCALVTMSDSSAFLKLKKMKNSICSGRCCFKGTGKFACKKCRVIKHVMCRNYHNLSDPLEELIGRLVYEYMFDIISLDDIEYGHWLHRDLRDAGHHLRMVKLNGLVMRSPRASQEHWLYTAER